MVIKWILAVLFTLSCSYSCRQPEKTEENVKRDDAKYETIDPVYRETDVRSLITIKNEEDIILKRKKLIDYIWNGKGFPDSKMPQSIEKDIQDIDLSLFDCEELQNVKSIDKITVSMEFGFNSIIYFFHPVHSSNRLIVYHQGHRDVYIAEEKTLQVALDKGYSIMTFLMPLKGINGNPVVDLPFFGKMKLVTHNQLIHLKSDTFSPIKLFLEPVATALNYAEKNYDFNEIHMMGISGGGWTTTLYAAIDTRIKKSYPAAGTWPLFLRLNRDWGDYEQFEPELYRIANYLELYILGAYGDSRKQMQVLNKYDSCCFAGIKYRLYEQVVEEAVKSLGKGSFDIYFDDSHRSHKISAAALKVILSDIESGSNQ